MKDLNLSPLAVRLGFSDVLVVDERTWSMMGGAKSESDRITEAPSRTSKLVSKILSTLSRVRSEGVDPSTIRIAIPGKEKLLKLRSTHLGHCGAWRIVAENKAPDAFIPGDFHETSS